jgi:hypothetical protein
MVSFLLHGVPTPSAREARAAALHGDCNAAAGAHLAL